MFGGLVIVGLLVAGLFSSHTNVQGLCAFLLFFVVCIILDDLIPDPPTKSGEPRTRSGPDPHCAW
jgi:hypothetical protein